MVTAVLATLTEAAATLMRPATRVPSMVKKRRPSEGMGLSYRPSSVTEAKRSRRASRATTTSSNQRRPLSIPFNPIFGPLSALAAIAYVVLPGFRDRLRWPTLVLVLNGALSIWAAHLSGNNLYDSERFAQVGGELEEKIDHHQSLADALRWITTGFAVLTMVAIWQHRRNGVTRYLFGALVVIGAVATIIWTVRLCCSRKPREPRRSDCPPISVTSAIC